MGSVIGKAGLTCRRKPVGWWGRAGEGGRPQVAFQKHQPAQLLPGVVWQSFWECLGQEEQAGLLHSAGELREGGSIPPKDQCDLTPTFFWVYFGERAVRTPGSHRAENCCTHPARLSVPGEDGEGRREEICLFFAEMLSLGEEPHPQALTSCREEQPRVCNGSVSCSVGPQPA